MWNQILNVNKLFFILISITCSFLALFNFSIFNVVYFIFNREIVRVLCQLFPAYFQSSRRRTNRFIIYAKYLAMECVSCESRAA